MPASARSWKCYEDNVLCFILLQVSSWLEGTLDPHYKEFHSTFKKEEEKWRPHALGGNCYRYFWALQPQAENIHKPRDPKSLKVFFQPLKEQGQKITAPPRKFSMKNYSEWVNSR